MAEREIRFRTADGEMRTFIAHPDTVETAARSVHVPQLHNRD